MADRPDASTAPEPYCPICRSGSPLPVAPPLPLRVLFVLIGQLVPIPEEWFQTRRMRCAVCAHEWRPSA